MTFDRDVFILKSLLRGRKIHMVELKKLDTEQRNERTMHIDTLSTLEMATLINSEDHQCAEAVKAVLPEIARAIDVIYAQVHSGGRLVYCGAGTSGRLGVLDAAECPPTFGVSDQVFIGIIAGGDTALRKAVEGAEDSDELARRDLESYSICDKDLVVAISASGTAAYCISSLKKAREIGALAVSICCNKGTLLSNYADIAIEMPTGAEVLSGSTRLRAGTATKMALNMISTAAMIRCGKAYKNLMVDVCATNTKLKDRAIRITMKATGLTREDASNLLDMSDGSIKQAIVMHETVCSAYDAKQALTAEGGFVRKAIAKLL